MSRLRGVCRGLPAHNFELREQVENADHTTTNRYVCKRCRQTYTAPAPMKHATTTEEA